MELVFGGCYYCVVECLLLCFVTMLHMLVIVMGIVAAFLRY